MVNTSVLFGVRVKC